jgi:outer membrane protein
MKKTIQLVTLIAFVFAAFTVSAQGVRPIKLGHIETGKLMEIMPEVKKAEEGMKTKAEEFQKTFDTMQAKWETLLKEYQENEKTYSEPKKKDMQQELQDLQRRMQRFEEEAGQQLQAARESLLKPIFDKIQNAIKQVGNENGFTYIFEMGSNAISYASPTSEDVLPLVKKKLGLL